MRRHKLQLQKRLRQCEKLSGREPQRYETRRGASGWRNLLHWSERGQQRLRSSRQRLLLLPKPGSRDTDTDTAAMLMVSNHKTYRL